MLMLSGFLVVSIALIVGMALIGDRRRYRIVLEKFKRDFPFTSLGREIEHFSTMYFDVNSLMDRKAQKFDLTICDLGLKIEFNSSGNRIECSITWDEFKQAQRATDFWGIIITWGFVKNNHKWKIKIDKNIVTAFPELGS